MTLSLSLLPLPRDLGRPKEDDELDPLPPLDGEPAEPEGEEWETDDFEGEGHPGKAPAKDNLDDSTGENDPIDATDLHTGGNESWLGDAEDAEDLDIGADDVTDSGDSSTSFVEADEPIPLGVDLGFDLQSEGLGLDTGEEGPETNDVEL